VRTGHREDESTAGSAPGEAAARLTALLQALGDEAVVAIDPDGTITEFSAGVERMLGCPEAEVVGHVSLFRFRDPVQLAERAGWASPPACR
jgi:PAS domain-containing protein